MHRINLEVIPLPARMEEWDVSEGFIRVLHSQVNRSWEMYTGLKSEDLLDDGFWERIHPEDREPLVRQVLTPSSDSFFARYRFGKTWQWIRTFLSTEAMQKGRYRALSLYDFDFESLKAPPFVLGIAQQRDPVTGALTREAFFHKLQSVLQLDLGFLPVVVVRLYRFDEVYVLFGHDQGDRILQSCAERLWEVVGSRAIMGRTGHEEFALALMDVQGFPDLVQIVDRINETFDRPFIVEKDGEEKIYLTPHIGVAIFPLDADKPRDLLLRARIAITAIRPTSASVKSFYSEQMEKGLLEVVPLRNELIEALQDHRLEVAYQPILNMDTLHVVGLEALVRWYHPVLGSIPPSKFVPLAEELGLIGRLGEFVLQRSLEDLASIEEDAIWLAVNFSPSELYTRQMLGRLDRALREANIEPGRVVVEITETAAMLNPEEAQEIFHQIKDLGCQIALDDFGTGYSSMTQLLNLELDRIKLDRSFVANLSENPRAVHLAEAIIELAHDLGARAVAEGIETETQLTLLRSWNCDEGQGYLFAKPMAIEDIRGFLKDWGKHKPAM